MWSKTPGCGNGGLLIRSAVTAAKMTAKTDRREKYLKSRLFGLLVAARKDKGGCGGRLIRERVVIVEQVHESLSGACDDLAIVG